MPSWPPPAPPHRTAPYDALLDHHHPASPSSILPSLIPQLTVFSLDMVRFFFRALRVPFLSISIYDQN